MAKEQYYRNTLNYYESVKNTWGTATNHPYLIEGFKFSLNAVEHVKIIAELADIKQGQYVLDCGCGFGGVLSIMNSLIPAHYTGITLNKYHIENKQFDNLLLANYEDMSFIGKESIDRIMFIESFSHAYNKINVLKEIHGLLKPGGKVFILDLSITNSDYRSLLTNNLYKRQYREHIRYYGDKPVSSEYVNYIATKCNFSVLDLREKLTNSVQIDQSLEDIIILHTINTHYNYYILQK
jgi:cyclopropane fatty-acyl-phospholipid synthase-like methyltransferase